MLPLTTYALLIFFRYDATFTYRARVDGIPTASYCETLGQTNAQPGIGWRCEKSGHHEETRRAFLRRLLSSKGKGRLE